jgi:hypothetical protein
MSQSDLGSPVVWFGIGGGRRTLAVLAVALLVGLAGFAWLGWRSTVPTFHPAAGNLVPVTGQVMVEGGPAVPSSASDIHPITSAPVLVIGVTTTGKRVLRRFAADRQGRFGLTLPPGRYTFTAVLYQGSIPLAQEPHATVRIRPGRQPRVEIVEQVA